MFLDVQVAGALLLGAAFAVQQLIQVDAAHLYRVVVVMVVNARVAKQATGAAGRSAGTKSPRFRCHRRRSNYVVQEDGPIFELLHTGQMVHQLGRQGFHVGIKVLLDALPLTGLVQRDNGRREEEQ